MLNAAYLAVGSTLCKFDHLMLVYWFVFLFDRLELSYEPVGLRDWMVANPMVPIIAVVLYGVFILAGRSYFQGRPAWNWRTSMALWNLFLSIFSAIGFCRVVTQLVHNFFHYSVPENFCFDPENFYGSGATGLWVQLFVLSKFPYVATPISEV
jgi:hypothetical protein